MIDGVSPDLPHTMPLSSATEWGLRVARPPVAMLLRGWWRVRVHGGEHVPRHGPVILAANHIGFLDGPLLVALTRRLTFAMAKQELFRGILGRVLGYIGQISLHRTQYDARAITTAIRVLRAGRVLAVFPEGVRGGGDVRWAKGGAAYLAMVSGAPIVPVALLGTRDPGRAKGSLPRRGTAIHIVYGEPMTVPLSPWPRRKSEVAAWTEVLRERLAEHVRMAQEETGVRLPGPPRPKVAVQ